MFLFILFEGLSIFDICVTLLCDVLLMGVSCRCLLILMGSVLLFISYQQVPASFFLGSSDEQVISLLAETVCIAALQNTERVFLDDFMGKGPGGFFSWLRKPQRIVSRDSSVVIYKLFEDEIVDNAKSLLENFNSSKERFQGIKVKRKYKWWTPLAHSKLEKIGGPEFSAWTSEHVPAYRLQIDADKVKDAKFEGWRESSGNRWEVLLTHSQMVFYSLLLS